MLVIPRATEKSYTEQTKNTYVFYVPEGGSKQAIAKAISEQYNVTVLDIRTLTRKGKATKFSKGKHAYPGTTFRCDKVIAYVRVKDGDKIRVFDEPEEVKDEKADKKAKKETKAKEEKK